MPTKFEQNLRASRAQSEKWLVPKLNELLKSPIGIDSQADAEFLYALAMKQVKREEERKRENGRYSPSGLASCLRQVYLRAHWKELGFKRVELPAIGPHYYFLTGDFIHLKWQFAFYKLSLMPGSDFTLVDCEVSVMSKHGDHGGTIDVVALNEGELIIIDVKGLNVRGFQKVDTGDTSLDYKIQVTDYMMLWNAAVQRGLIKPNKTMAADLGFEKFPHINRAVILAESKGGPDLKHPAALTEQIVRLKDSLPDVRTRLEILRAHEEEETLPEIECVTTRSTQFESCPFAEVCRKEIKKRERKSKNRNPAKYRVARTKRSDSPRRPRPKR